MSEPFLGEIRVVSFSFAPKGWAFCNGQLLPINQNQALFSLLGTTYGGDGRVTFALPNLQDRVPLCFGQGVGLSNYDLGAAVGEAYHALTPGEIPSHAHAIQAAAGDGGIASPADAALADSGSTPAYSAGSPNTAMSAAAIAAGVPAQPHENEQPYLTLNFVIALQGIFPSRN